MPRTEHLGQKSQSVPFLDLHRQYAGIQAEVLSAIARVCSSQQFILGSEVEALENEISAFIGTKAAVGCASGTDALWLALAAAGVGGGDKVITTSFSFFASASSIVRAGAEPVLMDVDPDTLNLDPAQVIAALHSSRVAGRSLNTRLAPALARSRFSRAALLHKMRARRKKNTRPEGIRAILPVHLYGQCADMGSLQPIAAEYGVAIIEDAAQAIGAKWGGQLAGTFGIAAAFSFYPTKNLSAYGEAGIVTTQDPKIAERVRLLRNHGSPKRYFHTEFGWNARMDAIQAAVLRVKLKHIAKWNQQRLERAETYDRLLVKAGLCQLRPGTTAPNQSSNGATASLPRQKTSRSMPSPLRLLGRSPHASHVFHQYVIRAQQRDKLRKFLATRGIATEVYYPIPLHLQPVFAYLGYKEGDLPESERAAKEVLALPMFPELTQDEQERVVAGIAEFYS